jgi:hypothetical protein
VHMKTPVGIASLLLLIACSCASRQPGVYTKQSGDLGVFILESAARYGGHPKTNAVPVVQAEWSSKPDANGIVIHLIGDHLSDVQSILNPAFGEPNASLGSKLLSPCSPPGRKNEQYSHKQLGISIYVWGETGETGIIILRGKT